MAHAVEAGGGDGHPGQRARDVGIDQRHSGREPARDDAGLGVERDLALALGRHRPHDAVGRDAPAAVALLRLLGLGDLEGAGEAPDWPAIASLAAVVAEHVDVAALAEDVHIGMKVAVEWTEIQDGWVLPNFRKG